MNYVLAALALTSTVFLAQGCGKIENIRGINQHRQNSFSPTKMAQGQQIGMMEDHMKDMMEDHMNDMMEDHMNDMMEDHMNHQQGENHQNHCMNSNNNHDSHSHGVVNKATNTFAQLTVTQNITPNKSVPLTIEIKDKAGKPISNFETFQEKLMHLIVVSDDLEFFSHLHPTYNENGQFQVEAKFPKAGNYTLFSDYKPAGQREQVSLMKTSIAGTKSPAAVPDFKLNKNFGNTQVKLDISQPNIKVGEEVNLTFNLQDTLTNQPVTNLKPYLGETGHLVIVKNSTNLTASDYIHAHALRETKDGKSHLYDPIFSTRNYKIWGQFNRNGEIITADFWLKVI